jgi:hypothetical protein
MGKKTLSSKLSAHSLPLTAKKSLDNLLKQQENENRGVGIIEKMIFQGLTQRFSLLGYFISLTRKFKGCYNI